ncbi:MAG: phage baseplate assembly protein V, partial [Deltaproteobacteria bacterium]|nr:phage baseplate assembly protein V [Deltaproteobacteria bacterium]
MKEAFDQEQGGARRFFGKYRGTVLNNVDPLKRGRLLVSVPTVLGGGVTSWAEPTMPMGGMVGLPSGMWLTPPVGAGAWVEFAEGDSNYPIWSGCWFGSESDTPLDATAKPPGQEPIVLQTETFKLMIGRERVEIG